MRSRTVPQKNEEEEKEEVRGLSQSLPLLDATPTFWHSLLCFAVLCFVSHCVSHSSFLLSSCVSLLFLSFLHPYSFIFLLFFLLPFFCFSFPFSLLCFALPHIAFPAFPSCSLLCLPCFAFHSLLCFASLCFLY